MQKWIINVILFIILVLGIWSLCAPEKSPVSKERIMNIKIGKKDASLYFVLKDGGFRFYS